MVTSRRYSNQNSKLGRFLARNGGDLVGGFRREAFGKLYRYPAFRRLLGKVTTVREPRKWVFLVGCYNSGTTLLRDVLNQHPDISALPFEGMRLTDAFEDLEASDWPRMMYRNRDRWDLPAEGAAEVVARAKRDWAPFWEKRATIFLEKSIDHTTRIAWLDRHFGDVCFVAITRNGLAVCEGILRRSRPRGDAVAEVGESYPIDMVAAQWSEFSRRIHEDLAGVAQGHRLRYEDLMERPKETIDAITAFLGLSPMTIDVSQAGSGQALTINGRKFTFSNQNAASIGRLGAEERAALVSAMKDELARNGYLAGEQDAG